ncbi:hypothetical protein [Streptomyces sp. PSKA30]|nr:hypothetical protein [Streptomyces sp. PSKA30]MBZ9641177.1 hypothetical protein [Streptomyces sp. PSKA30]
MRLRRETGFHLRLGFRETGRVPGVPGGHEEVAFPKVIGAARDAAP